MVASWIWHLLTRQLVTLSTPIMVLTYPDSGIFWAQHRNIASWDAEWCRRFRSTLVQVLAWCLMPPGGFNCGFYWPWEGMAWCPSHSISWSVKSSRIHIRIYLLETLDTNHHRNVFEIYMPEMAAQWGKLNFGVPVGKQMSLICSILTHLPLDKMATISQMIFADAFSWIKSFVVWLKCHWSLFLRVQLTITQYWFR